MIIVEGLDAGWYSITKLAPPKGYLIAAESKDVLLEQGTAVSKYITVAFENTRKPNLTIIKTDAQTGTSLPGARFEVKGHALLRRKDLLRPI